jgi:LPS-assembly lipoprotein
MSAVAGTTTKGVVRGPQRLSAKALMHGRRAMIGWGILAALSLNGCGWTPMYADVATGPADAELRAVRVAPIAERVGQKLAIALRDSLNPSGEPTSQRYVLGITLQVVRLDLGVLTQGIGTRGRLEVYASVTLTDIAGNTALLSLSSHVNESFDILANQYSNVVTEEDARNRAVEELRRDILARLTVFFQRRAAAAGRP